MPTNRANAFWLIPFSLRYAESFSMAASLHDVQRSAIGNIAPRALARLLGTAYYPSMQLARLRALRGLSQKALGELVGVDASTINRAEKMRDSAKLLTYKMCGQALGVSLADIFADDQTPVEREFLEVFRKIPAERHEDLLGLLRLARSHDPA